MPEFKRKVDTITMEAMPPVKGRPAPGSEVTYVGIDPGLSGGLVAITGLHVETHHCSASMQDLWDWLADRVNESLDPGGGPQVKAVLEKVGGYVPNEGGGQPGSAMFKFGHSAGALEMALVSLGIPYELVPPATWQKALGVPPKKKGKGGETSGKFKARLRAFAQHLFPRRKITGAVADAFLIAEYCRRKHEGRLSR